MLPDSECLGRRQRPTCVGYDHFWRGALGCFRLKFGYPLVLGDAAEGGDDGQRVLAFFTAFNMSDILWAERLHLRQSLREFAQFSRHSSLLLYGQIHITRVGLPLESTKENSEFSGETVRVP